MVPRAGNARSIFYSTHPGWPDNAVRTRARCAHEKSERCAAVTPIRFDPWPSLPPCSATACSPESRRRRASAALCGQPRSQGRGRPSLPLPGTAGSVGRHAPASCAESGRWASARTERSRLSGAVRPCWRPASDPAAGQYVRRERGRPLSRGSPALQRLQQCTCADPEQERGHARRRCTRQASKAPLQPSKRSWR